MFQNHATIQSQDHILRVAGDMSFPNVASLWNQSLPLLSSHSEWIFDFSGVTGTSSAGLALIIEWVKYANACQKKIHFQNMPPKLISIAEVVGLRLFKTEKDVKSSLVLV